MCSTLLVSGKEGWEPWHEAYKGKRGRFRVWSLCMTKERLCCSVSLWEGWSPTWVTCIATREPSCRDFLLPCHCWSVDFCFSSSRIAGPTKPFQSWCHLGRDLPDFLTFLTFPISTAPGDPVRWRVPWTKAWPTSPTRTFYFPNDTLQLQLDFEEDLGFFPLFLLRTGMKYKYFNPSQFCRCSPPISWHCFLGLCGCCGCHQPIRFCFDTNTFHFVPPSCTKAELEAYIQNLVPDVGRLEPSGQSNDFLLPDAQNFGHNFEARIAFLCLYLESTHMWDCQDRDCLLMVVCIESGF